MELGRINIDTSIVPENMISRADEAYEIFVLELDGVCRALYGAVAKRRRAVEEASRFTELTQVGYAERTGLLKYTEALMFNGRLPAVSLENIDRGNGRLALSSSLIDLARLHLDPAPTPCEVETT